MNAAIVFPSDQISCNTSVMVNPVSPNYCIPIPNSTGITKQNTQLYKIYKMRVTTDSQPSSCASLDITSMAAEGQLAAWPQDEREPLIHMMDDRNREKKRWDLSQAMTRL